MTLDVFYLNKWFFSDGMRSSVMYEDLKIFVNESTWWGVDFFLKT